MEEKDKNRREGDWPASQKGKAKKANKKVYGAFAMQPITKPDRRFPQTNVARPSDESVEENRDWVNFNKK